MEPAECLAGGYILHEVDRFRVEDYLSDLSREGDPLPRSFSGTAGGAPCGDLLRFSITVVDGHIAGVTRGAEGCAVARAASAALAEAIEGIPLIEAARIDEDFVAELLGGLASTHRHAAELAVDALSRALSLVVGSDEILCSADPSQDRALVALSGGVDSGLAAQLIGRDGTETLAVTLKLWQDPLNDGERSCCSPEAVLRARRLAHSLGMPHFTLDLRDWFGAEVVGGFISGYAAGRTPNPCVICNGEVRIDAMLALAERLGASRLVTGHYARVVDDGEGKLLARPRDLDKDQTHMLAALGPESVQRLELPLAEMTKSEVRELARDYSLPVASQPESQDLCFLAGEGKVDFLKRHGGLEDRKGEIVDTSGEVIGTHRGYHRYTVGQRKGLGIGGGEPMFVLGVEADSNRVLVGPREDLERSEIRLSEVRLYRAQETVDSIRIRSHQEPIPCVVSSAEGESDLSVTLQARAVAVAPGQSATLYAADLVVGQGTIEAAPVPRGPLEVEFAGRR